MVSKGYIIIGKLIKPFGLRGEILFISYSETIDTLKSITTLSLGSPQYQYTVEYWTGGKQNSKLRCKLQSVDSPEQARLHCGKDVITLRKNLQKLGDNEWHVTDIISMKVLCKKKEVGRILAVSQEEFQPLLSIQWKNGKTGLIPFNEHFFALPDTEHASIELIEPELIEHS